MILENTTAFYLSLTTLITIAKNRAEAQLVVDSRNASGNSHPKIIHC